MTNYLAGAALAVIQVVVIALVIRLINGAMPSAGSLAFAMAFSALISINRSDLRKPAA